MNGWGEGDIKREAGARLAKSAGRDGPHPAGGRGRGEQPEGRWC